MCPASSALITELLANWCQGSADAREALIPLVYNELRRIARRHLWRQRPNHTLQSAALVNEAYLRLVRQKSPREVANLDGRRRGAFVEPERSGAVLPKREEDDVGGNRYKVELFRRHTKDAFRRRVPVASSDFDP